MHHTIRSVYLLGCITGVLLWVLPLLVWSGSAQVLAFARSRGSRGASESDCVSLGWPLGMALRVPVLGQPLRGSMLVWYVHCQPRASLALNVAFATILLILLVFLNGKTLPKPRN